jgi:hypothetical protein
MKVMLPSIFCHKYRLPIESPNPHADVKGLRRIRRRASGDRNIFII